jgi:hypothetical protein
MAEFRLGRLKFNWTGAWTPSTAYVIDDIIKIGGNTYVCTSNHTSVGSTSGWYSSDFGKWSLHIEGLSSTGDFVPGRYYTINEVFKYGNTQYRVTTGFSTSTADPVGIATTSYVEYVPGVKGEGSYSSLSEYQTGDIVQYNGNSYVAISSVSAGALPSYSGSWSILSTGFNPNGISTYTPGSAYFNGDIVQVGGNAYRLKVGVATGIDPLVDTIGGGQIGTAWGLFNTGLKFAGTYSGVTTYYPNNVVEYSSSAYVAIGTAAITGITPGTNPAKWSALAIGDSNAVLTTKGDILFRDASAPTRLAIGSTYNALGIGTTGVPQWMQIGDSTRVYYVDPELGSDTYSGATPDLAFRTLNYACQSASQITNITNAVYDRISGVTTITAPSHGILYSGVTVQLSDIIFECLSGGRVVNVTDFKWSSIGSGIATVSTGSTNYAYAGQTVRLRNINLQIVGGGSTIFPFNNGNNFTIAGVNSPTEFTINVGVGTTTYTYLSGGTAFVGLNTASFPYDPARKQFDVIDVVDNDTLKVNVGVSSITHDYVSGGTVKNLSPAIVKLSASQFAEQLPITVPSFTSIVGSTLRASKVGPAAGISSDGVTPNNRQKMFLLSDATTIQGINVSGLVGFNFNPIRPYELDATTVRTGLGTTACGIYFSWNPYSPILHKSPYVKDCTSFSDPATDGTGHGGGVGVFMDGGVHATGFKSMVFDAYTNVNSDGAGFILDKDARAEIVSCFTYYAKWGYYSGGGSRIRGVGGNNSYGTYGVIASGFSTAETARTARVFGDRMDTTVGTYVGTIGVGDSIRGVTSKARGNIINDQRSSDRFYFKYEAGYGSPSAGIGTTSFVNGEYIDVIGAGTTGQFKIAAVAGSVSGQKGVILEIDNCSAVPTVGDAVGFSTTGIGSDSRYYIITTVSGFTTSYELKTSTGIVTYSNKVTLRMSPEKASETPDVRGLVSTGSTITIRTNFSNARLTGHDFLSIGTGNKTTTNYPNIDESTVAQGNEKATFGPGKVFYVSTDQGGNFRVGDFFSVNQLTGSATLDASAFNLSGLTELRLGSLGGQIGEAVNEFSADETMSGNSNQACPTEFAVVGYIKRAKMGNDAMVPPLGTTGQRPGSPLTGAFRYNTTTGYPEYYSGANWKPAGELQNNTISSSQTVTAFQRLFVNTSGGAVTATLPVSPVLGDRIQFLDVANSFNTNQLTVGRNSEKINGDSADMTVAIQGAAFELVYSGATYGWRIFTV